MLENINIRLDKKTIPEPNTGCILYFGTLDKNGYGKIYYNKKHQRVHRLVYELKNGKIPRENIIQHKCDTPSCCNIEHLELGTYKSNMVDKVNKGRLKNYWLNKSNDLTKCKKGHEYNDVNTLMRFGSSGNLVRMCKICYISGWKNRNKIKAIISKKIKEDLCIKKNKTIKFGL